MKQPDGLQTISTICGLFELLSIIVSVILFVISLIKHDQFGLFISLYFLMFGQCFDVGKRYSINYDGEEMI